MTVSEAFKADFRQRVERELRENILPFWVRHTPDPENGGFYGALTNDLQILNDQPRSAVVCARILWTYAAAYRLYPQAGYLAMAERAYNYLLDVFWDKAYEGVYWQVDRHGRPVSDRKHSYAQAFAIYGLAEYYRAAGQPESLERARRLYALLEARAYDPAHGGYVEGRGRKWEALADMRLSDKEPVCDKSMNTLLHIMEGYTNLLRAWDDARLRAQQRALVGLFLEKVVDPETHHLRQFFDAEWRSQGDPFSFGHDIEAAWLLVEAAEGLGDEGLLARARQAALAIAQAVYAEGRDADGSLCYESAEAGPDACDKHWWAQAEAVVGFYTAYQLSDQAHFAEAARQVWQYIEDKFVDRTHGDWFKVLNRAGVPYPDQVKTGPWECPYHHSRACYEMLARLEG
jgi:mannobiose 2-epimerase